MKTKLGKRADWRKPVIQLKQTTTQTTVKKNSGCSTCNKRRQQGK